MAFFVFELINYVRETAWINLIVTSKHSADDNASDLIKHCRPILAALNVKQSPMLPRLNRRLNTSAKEKLNTPIDLAPYGKNSNMKSFKDFMLLFQGGMNQSCPRRK